MGPLFETILHLDPHGKTIPHRQEMQYPSFMGKERFQEVCPKSRRLDRLAGPSMKTGERELNLTVPAGGDLYQSLLGASKEGDTGRWICEGQAGGIRYA
jgi:hypothetical protein